MDKRREYLRRYMKDYRNKDKEPEIPPSLIHQSRTGKIFVYLCPNKHRTFSAKAKEYCEEKGCYQRMTPEKL